MSQSLVSHTAWLTAADVVRAMPGLTDDERQTLLPLVYASARKGIGYYAERAERMDKRLHPLGGGT